MLLVAHVSAGIVEDAEEELKKLDAAREGRVGVGVGSDTVSGSEYPSALTPASSGVPSPDDSKRGRVAGDNSSLGSQPGVVSIEAEKDQSRKKRVVTNGGKERTYSLIGIVLLLLLVAGGAALGREGIREE